MINPSLVPAMNRVMRNYTPDLKASRKSTIGPPLTAAASMSGCATRRRYSIAAATVSFGASISVSVNGRSGENAPPTGASSPMPSTPTLNVRRSLSQGATPVAISSKKISLHENLMMKILATPVDQPLSLDDSDLSDVSFCSSIGTPLTSEQLIESDDLLRCTTPPSAVDYHSNPRLARLYRDLQSPSATTRIRALRALKSPSKREAYGQFDVPHEEQDIITAEERKSPQRRTIQEIMTGVCIYVEVRSGADNRSDGIKDHVACLGAKVNDRLYKDTTHVIFKDGLLSTYQKAKKMNIPVVSILWIEACKRHMCLMNPDSFPISNQERYENPELFKKIRRQKSMQPRAEEAPSSGGKKRPPLGASNGNSGTGSSAAAKSGMSPPSKLPVLHRLRKDDGLERILSEFQAENQNTPEPLDDFDKLLAGPMKLLEKFRNSPASATGGVAESSTVPEKESAMLDTPEPPLHNIRKSLFVGSAEKDDSAAKRVSNRRRSSSVNKEIAPVEKPTPVPRQRRKTMLFTPRITSVVEEIESPPVPVPPVSEGKPIRNRRKTMVVSMKENSPPKKRETISSPKAMELCKANSDICESMQTANVSRSTQKDRGTIYSPSRMEQSTERTGYGSRVEVVSSRRTLYPTTTQNVINGSARKTKTPELDPKDLEVFRTNRRRTLYTPGVYEESDKQLGANDTPILNRRSTIFNPAANSTETDRTPMATSSLQKRRTLYTPNPSVDVPETPETPAVNRRHTVFTPKPEVAPSPKTPASVIQKGSKTLLEEYQSSLTFSSTKTPISERRKTIFDISMDIIDKRLSQINKQSKKTDLSGVASVGLSRSESAELALKSPPPRPSSVSRQTSLDTFYRKMSKSTEKSIKFKSSTDLHSTADITDKSSTIPRKRKLFNAQPSITESPLSSHDSDPPVQTSTKRCKTPVTSQPTPVASKTPAQSKRRSLATQPALATKSVPAIKTTSRRSTMFFEGTSSQPTVSARPVMGTQARTMKALGLGAGLPTMSSQQVAVGRGPQYHLATTNLHASQHAFVKEAVLTLGGFIVENDVNDKTTHLVTLESRRTINILRALARGLWIVTYEWIEQSFHIGRWLSEEQFEMRDFSAAVQICRSERQAFGPKYRMELFADCGPFYVSDRCEVPQDKLRELIITCKEIGNCILMNECEEQRKLLSGYWSTSAVNALLVPFVSCFSIHKYRIHQSVISAL